MGDYLQGCKTIWNGVLASADELKIFTKSEEPVVFDDNRYDICICNMDGAS
mgnify:CR=1 FL=1